MTPNNPNNESSSVTVIDTPIDIMDRLDTATFEELATTVTDALELATAHAKATIEQLIKVGGALSEMRDRMPGRYTAWLRESGISVSWASKCQRLHMYADRLPTEAFQPHTTTSGRRLAPTLGRAVAMLSNLEALPTNPNDALRNAEAVKAIERMRAAGATRNEIARALGANRKAVSRVIMGPAALAEHRKRVAEAEKERRRASSALRKQVERAERDALARSSGHELAIAYAAIRRALAALGRTDQTNTDPTAIQKANSYLSAAESALVAAMRAERTQ